MAAAAPAPASSKRRRSRARRNPEEQVAGTWHRVPAAIEPKHGGRGPEEDREGQAGDVRRLLPLRGEGVRVPPRGAAVLELVADEPVVVQRLQVVAGGSFAVCGRAAREEVRASVQGRRPGRGRGGREIQSRAERYKACAARRSSSKSGTSA